jgi:hypothetical protein
MKIITVLLLILAFANACASKEKEECVTERWLILYKNKNKAIFNPASSKLDPYQEIKQLLLSGEIRLWSAYDQNEERLSQTHPSSLRDSIEISDTKKFYSPYFDYQKSRCTPIQNSNNEDSMKLLSDGFFVAIYPMPEYAPLTFKKITEFRIKEILIHDPVTNTAIMKPVLLGFDAYVNHHNVLFWVQIYDLETFMKINIEWVYLLVDKKYDGFTYKQYSCQDSNNLGVH